MINIQDKFNKLTVLEYIGTNKHGSKVYECICDCGKITNATSTVLTKNIKKSCGCLRSDIGKLNLKHIIQIGDKFNKLTTIGFINTQKIQFLCDCGNITIKNKMDVINNKTTSCGCVKREQTIQKNTTHGLSRTRLHKIYFAMKTRCYNENTDGYKYYGKKGITICNEWLLDFKNFYNWAISNGYQDNLTIERKDYTKNYNPNNCTWIPISQQPKNKSDNNKITAWGETKNITDWTRDNRCSITRVAILRRMRKNIPAELAISCKTMKECYEKLKGE